MEIAASIDFKKAGRYASISHRGRGLVWRHFIASLQAQNIKVFSMGRESAVADLRDEYHAMDAGELLTEGRWREVLEQFSPLDVVVNTVGIFHAEDSRGFDRVLADD